MVARILLEPGDTVIVNNHRAMHGREAFKVRSVSLCRLRGETQLRDETTIEIRPRLYVTATRSQLTNMCTFDSLIGRWIDSH